VPVLDNYIGLKFKQTKRTQLLGWRRLKSVYSVQHTYRIKGREKEGIEYSISKTSIQSIQKIRGERQEMTLKTQNIQRKTTTRAYYGFAGALDNRNKGEKRENC
jgi:hypothetical protein